MRTAVMAPGAGRAIPAKDQPIPIPPGAPMITVLGSYVTRVVGSELGMRCRKCPVEFQGSGMEVHAGLRAHHDVAHPMAPVTQLVVKNTKPPKPPRALKVRAPRPSQALANLVPCTALVAHGARAGQECAHPSQGGRCGNHNRSPEDRSAAMLKARQARSWGQGRPATQVPCTVPIRQGARVGQPCGRMSPSGTCYNHDDARLSQVERQRAIRAAAREVEVPLPPTECVTEGCPVMVEHSRRLQAPPSRYCSVQCRDRAKRQREKARGVAS